MTTELQKETKAEPATLRNLGEALSNIVAGKSPKAASNPASAEEFGVLKVSAAGDGVFIEDENKALLDPLDFVPSVEVKLGMILVTRCNALLSGVGRACLVEKTRPGLMSATRRCNSYLTITSLTLTSCCKVFDASLTVDLWSGPLTERKRKTSRRKPCAQHRFGCRA